MKYRRVVDQPIFLAWPITSRNVSVVQVLPTIAYVPRQRVADKEYNVKREGKKKWYYTSKNI